VVKFEYIWFYRPHASLDLEKKLEAAIDAAKVGEFDATKLRQDGSDGTLYMYGRMRIVFLKQCSLY